MSVVSPDGLTTITRLPATGVAELGADIRRLDLETSLLSPETTLWVTPDDSLTLFFASSLNAVKIQIVGRVLLWDGTVTIFGGSVTTHADTLTYIADFPLQYGFLLAVTVYTFGTLVPSRGQTFCQAVLTRKGAPRLLHIGLGFDYLTALNAINWPYARNISAPEGPGYPRSILGTAPAAGTEWVQTVPNYVRWRLRGIVVPLTTSGVAGNRFADVAILDSSGNVLHRTDQGSAQGAGVGPTYHWTAGYPVVQSSTQSRTEWLPPDLILFTGWQLKSSTVGMDAGDQYGAPRFHIEEWLDD